MLVVVSVTRVIDDTSPDLTSFLQPFLVRLILLFIHNWRRNVERSLLDQACLDSTPLRSPPGTTAELSN